MDKSYTPLSESSFKEQETKSVGQASTRTLGDALNDCMKNIEKLVAAICLLIFYFAILYVSVVGTIGAIQNRGITSDIIWGDIVPGALWIVIPIVLLVYRHRKKKHKND